MIEMAESRFRPVMVNLCLWCAIVLTALLVVWSTHQCRELVAQLMSLQAQENRLLVEHGQYLLQEGTLSAPSRLEQDARARLGMRIPDPAEIRVIRP